MNKIIKLTKELSTLQRKRLILKLLSQQKEAGAERELSRDDCTLVDLRAGLIVGSGLCPHCHGFTGRAPDYVDNSKRKK